MRGPVVYVVLSYERATKIRSQPTCEPGPCGKYVCKTRS